jgi:KDO2-lipid IV(A) lauroyltransferase
MLGKAAFCFPNRERTLTLQHVGMIFGDRWTPQQVRSCARGVYGDLAKNAFDALYFSRQKDRAFERYVECDDMAQFRRAYDRGRGVVAITAHCGCFEMLLHYFAFRGFSCFAIGSRLYDERLDSIVKDLRSGPNIAYLHRSDNLRGMINLLREGRVLGALIDQDTKVDGVFARFLGKLAYTPWGAIKLARRRDIPVFVVTTARLAHEKHGIFISDEILLHETGDETEDCVRAIERINGHISETIERFPSQWVWMHRRWNKRPEDEGMRGVPNIEKYGSKLIHTTSL